MVRIELSAKTNRDFLVAALETISTSLIARYHFNLTLVYFSF